MPASDSSNFEPIRVTGLEVDRLSIRLAQPLSISFHTLHRQENLYLRIRDEKGFVGWGEAAPLKAITGDSIDEAVDEATAFSLEKMPKLAEPETFYHDFIRHVGSATLRAALDFAVHDLSARRRGVPVYKLYSAQPRIVPNSVTVFIQESPDTARDEARRRLEKHPHVKILKIKLRGNRDLDDCRAVKEVCPRHLQYILDANQGFSDAARAIEEIGEIVQLLGQVMLVEEPCRKGDYESMAQVREGLRGTLVFADESCADEADLDRIITTGCADGVNIKLQKAGGLIPARSMAQKAQEAGLKVMLGAMFETPLSHAAGAHFAAFSPNVMLTDLDMDLDLPVFFKGRLPFRDGSRIPQETPGWGFDLDLPAVEQLQREGAIELKTAVRLQL